MSSLPHRTRPRRGPDSKPPGSLPSEIANAILDLSNRAEWTKLAIGKLKPTQIDTDARAAEDGPGDRPDGGDRPDHDDRPCA